MLFIDRKREGKKVGFFQGIFEFNIESSFAIQGKAFKALGHFT